MLWKNGKLFKVNGVIFNQFLILQILIDNYLKKLLYLKELILHGEVV